MRTGTEHFFTVRGRGFDDHQWETIIRVAQKIISRAKEDLGLNIHLNWDMQSLRVIPSEGEPLVIWKQGEPDIPKLIEVSLWNTVVQSILAAIKQVAPDRFTMTSPNGFPDRRVLAKGKIQDILLEIVGSLDSDQEIPLTDLIRNPKLRGKHFGDILRAANALAKRGKIKINPNGFQGIMLKKASSRSARHEEGKSVDVGKWLRENGHEDAAEKWEKYEGEIDKMATRVAEKWIQDAIQKPGRVRRYLGIPEGETIPMDKLDAAIEKVKGSGNKSLLSALLLAKRLKTEL